jgi:hypothetical protein
VHGEQFVARRVAGLDADDPPGQRRRQQAGEHRVASLGALGMALGSLVKPVEIIEHQARRQAPAARLRFSSVHRDFDDVTRPGRRASLWRFSRPRSEDTS